MTPISPLFKQILLPNNIRNFKIQDNIPDSSQIVEIIFKTPFYYEDTRNSATPKIERTVIDFYATQNGSSKLFLILSGRNGVCGENLLTTSPTGINIIGYYFLWSMSTNYPIYTDFGLVDLNNNIDIYTVPQQKNSVALYWTNVDIWNIGNKDSDNYRQLFFDKIEFKFPSADYYPITRSDRKNMQPFFSGNGKS